MTSVISQWNSNEFCHFWNQLQNNFQHELSTKKRSLDKNFLAILRTFDDTIKSIFIKKEKKTSTTTRPQFPRNQVQGLSTFYPPPPLSSMPILLGSCWSSFGKRGARPPREEKRRKCRFPRGQKLQPARARPAVSYRHATGQSLSFAGGRCTRSPNDYALFILYKREQPCTSLPQFVRNRFERRTAEALRAFVEGADPSAIFNDPPNLGSNFFCRRAELATWGIYR